MPSFLRGSRPVSASKTDDHEDYNVEYSFAVEYSGPPLSYSIPNVVPVDMRRIPTASVVSSASPLDNLMIPVVQPIRKRENTQKEVVKRSKTSAVVASSLVTGKISRGGFQGSGRIVPCDEVDQVAEGVEKSDASFPIAVSDGAGSSGDSDISASQEMNQTSGSSDIDEIIGNPELETRGSVRLPNSNAEIMELNLSSPNSFSEIVPCEELGEGTKRSSFRGNRTTVVTFCDHQESDISSEEGSLEKVADVVQRPVARSDVKKVLCHRCGKGNWLTEKEACIVCGAKYCSSCLLKAMGSMPEGRKCITCIGFPIDESKRVSLGKSSKMLKQLLTRWQVKQVLRDELSCEVNQLPPDLVFVNGRPLSVHELTALQRCRHPPKKLKPGKYWYDRVSGFWGKEGHKPSQIISPLLDVGDALKLDASNGKTNVRINNRVISKTELWMLQLAGVQCEGNPHFWMSEDGSYQEEGQKMVREKLWEKSGIKFICAALSLPIPPQSHGEEVKTDADKVGSVQLSQNLVSKLVLVGGVQSGSSTIFKQAKILYNVPFSEAERQSIKFMIQGNVYRYIAIILEGREMFEEERLQELWRQRISQPGPSVCTDQREEKTEYSIDQSLEAFSDLLLQVVLCGNLEAFILAASQEYSKLVGELLHNSGFQAAYHRRNELHALPRVANYFLDHAAEILREDYEPSEMDILYAEGITSFNGVASMEFSFPVSPQNGYLEPVDENDPSIRYQLIRAHASNLGPNCKWLERFEDVDLVLFCVSLTEYDEFVVDSDGVCTNKMLASRDLFETVISHLTFVDKNFLLILNKYDLLEEKLGHVPLRRCDWFQDFDPVISHHQSSTSTNNNASMDQHAFHYIAMKFKRLFSSLTGRKLYVTCVTGLEPESVEEALKYGREILKWEEENAAISRNEFSGESTEGSTFS